jgi:hypothetical protein
MSPHADDTRRITGSDHTLCNVLCHNSSSTHDRSSADCHARSDERVSANPSSVADRDRRFYKRKLWQRVVMGTGAEMSILRNCDLSTDANEPQGIKNGAIADGRFIADVECPRNDYPDTWVDMYIPSNTCAERTQKEPAPAPEDPRAPSKQRVRKCPQHSTS